jgi:hypothetical protein
MLSPADIFLVDDCVKFITLVDWWFHLDFDQYKLTWQAQAVFLSLSS